MKLPKIYEHFSYGQVFTIDEAREKLATTGNTLRKRLSELSGRNYIHPIRQGLYRVARPGERPDARASDPFHVASKITPAGYVAFGSALELHAGGRPAPGSSVYVVSATKFNSFEFEDRLFFWCQNPDAEGVERITRSDAGVEYEVRVTTFEKSVVDCLKRTAHSPSLERLEALCLEAKRRPDLARLVKLASECRVAALFNRLGFFLERMAEAWEVPASMLEECERRMSRKVTEWPLVVPDSFRAAGEDGSARARWRLSFLPPAGAPLSKGSVRAGAAAAMGMGASVETSQVAAARAGVSVASETERDPAESHDEPTWFHA